MRNGPETIIGQAVVFPTGKAAETSEALPFTTAITNGEGIIIDGIFILIYRGAADRNRVETGRAPGKKSRVTVIKNGKDRLYMGPDKEHLEEHSAVPFSPIYFKPNPTHRVIVLEESELHISEIFAILHTFEGLRLKRALKLNSPAIFSFERTVQTIGFSSLQERLTQRLREIQRTNNSISKP